jgi:hypothetical protein
LAILLSWFLSLILHTLIALVVEFGIQRNLCFCRFVVGCAGNGFEQTGGVPTFSRSNAADLARKKVLMQAKAVRLGHFTGPSAWLENASGMRASYHFRKKDCGA